MYWEHIFKNFFCRCSPTAETMACDKDGDSNDEDDGDANVQILSYAGKLLSVQKFSLISININININYAGNLLFVQKIYINFYQ